MSEFQVIIRDANGVDCVFNQGNTDINLPRVGEKVTLWDGDSDNQVAFGMVESVEWIFDIKDENPSYSVFIFLSDEKSQEATE